jgi:small subunit ribosomal protein S23
MRLPKMKVMDIQFREDEIRQRFFQDFPFEALRPVTMVEMRGVREDHPIRGDKWTSLAQRGAYPTVEE